MSNLAATHYTPSREGAAFELVLHHPAGSTSLFLNRDGALRLLAHLEQYIHSTQPKEAPVAR